jgi:hypothetical protein
VAALASDTSHAASDDIERGHPVANYGGSNPIRVSQ